MIQSILCEGKYDIWFFDQISQHRGIKSHNIHDDLSKYQELIGGCAWYLMQSGDNPLLIFGDNGRTNLYRKYLNRIFREYIGRFDDHVNIFLVMDDDYATIGELTGKVSVSLNSIKNNSQFMSVVEIEHVENKFIISHPKSQYKVTVEVYTIPKSLEKQTIDYCCEIHKHENIADEDLHTSIRLLANKYYDRNKEKMFRDFADENCNEQWVTAIYDNIIN